MDTKICLFCESEYGDPMQPSLVDKVAALCHLTSNKHQLIDRKMCMRLVVILHIYHAVTRICHRRLLYETLLMMIKYYLL